MQHSLQDAFDTAARREASRGAVWHPLMAAVETEPGVWYMVGSTGKCRGVIRLLRRGDELGYRAVTWAPESADRQLIGYYRTLRAACEATHQRFISEQGSGPMPVVPATRQAIEQARNQKAG